MSLEHRVVMAPLTVRLAIEAHPTMEADSARNPFSAALPSQMNRQRTGRQQAREDEQSPQRSHGVI